MAEAWQAPEGRPWGRGGPLRPAPPGPRRVAQEALPRAAPGCRQHGTPRWLPQDYLGSRVGCRPHIWRRRKHQQLPRREALSPRNFHLPLGSKAPVCSQGSGAPTQFEGPCTPPAQPPCRQGPEQLHVGCPEGSQTPGAKQVGQIREAAGHPSQEGDPGGRSTLGVRIDGPRAHGLRESWHSGGPAAAG